MESNADLVLKLPTSTAAPETISTDYKPGDIVLLKQASYPYWPAIICDIRNVAPKVLKSRPKDSYTALFYDDQTINGVCSYGFAKKEKILAFNPENCDKVRKSCGKKYADVEDCIQRAIEDMKNSYEERMAIFIADQRPFHQGEGDYPLSLPKAPKEVIEKADKVKKKPHGNQKKSKDTQNKSSGAKRKLDDRVEEENSTIDDGKWLEELDNLDDSVDYDNENDADYLGQSKSLKSKFQKLHQLQERPKVKELVLKKNKDNI